MFVIGTLIYTALTILYIPLLLVFLYIIIVNNRYRDIMCVYNIETHSAVGWMATITTIYLFLFGFCLGELPKVWTNSLFLVCFIGSIFLSITICKILNFINRDRIKYANVMLADEQIMDKLDVATKQMNELKNIMNITSGTSPEMRAINKAQLDDMNKMLSKLVEIHQELQKQKVIMNAGLSTNEMKNVTLKDSRTVHKTLDYNKAKFEANNYICDDYRSVKKLMKKYNI